MSEKGDRTRQGRINCLLRAKTVECNTIQSCPHENNIDSVWNTASEQKHDSKNALHVCDDEMERNQFCVLHVFKKHISCIEV
jgi:hypothetical protein